MALEVRIVTRDDQPDLDIDFHLLMAEEPSAEFKDILDSIVNAWYHLGSLGGFSEEGRIFQFVSDISFQWEDEGFTAQWSIDANGVVLVQLDGKTVTEPVHVLRRCLEDLSKGGFAPATDDRLIPLRLTLTGYWGGIPVIRPGVYGRSPSEAGS